MHDDVSIYYESEQTLLLTPPNSWGLHAIKVWGLISEISSVRWFRDAYCICDDLMCHRGPRGWVPIGSSTPWQESMRLCHDDITTGHLGRDRAAQRIAERYLWPYFRKDAKIRRIMLKM